MLKTKNIEFYFSSFRTLFNAQIHFFYMDDLSNEVSLNMFFPPLNLRPYLGRLSLVLLIEH